jgi:hypothetical protein
VQSNKLPYVAGIKHAYCNNAVKIITISMVLLSLFVIGFVMAMLPGWLHLGSFIMFIAISVISIICVSLLILYFQRHPGIR